MLDLLKDIQNPPSPRFNDVISLEKLCQTVMARNDHANLQPTLNKGVRGASLTIFANDCSQCDGKLSEENFSEQPPASIRNRQTTFF